MIECPFTGEYCRPEECAAAVSVTHTDGSRVYRCSMAVAAVALDGIEHRMYDVANGGGDSPSHLDLWSVILDKDEDEDE